MSQRHPPSRAGQSPSRGGYPSATGPPSSSGFPASPGFPAPSTFPASPSAFLASPAGFPASPSFATSPSVPASPAGYPPSSPGFPAPPATSARAAYPKFLSLQETVWLQLTWAWHGLRDAFRWDLVYATIMSDQEIRANIVKSLLLNLLSLASIYGFDLLLAPLLHGQTRWVHRNVGWFYQALWLLPVVGTSFYLNSTWCTLIAKRTFALQHGSRAAAPPSQSYAGMLRAIATSAYRGVMVITSVALSLALGMVPRVGRPMELAFLCWVDAYYCFEFVWIARNMALARRVRYLEERWAYFFAFGLPASLLCTCGTGLANGAIFALVFPMYIIMAMRARPVPTDPYNPGSSETHHPSPFVPIRLRVFALIMWLNDWVVRAVSVGGGGKARGHDGGNAKPTGHRRGMSDGAEESLEQGESGSGGLGGSGSASRAFAARPTATRVQIGRRKAD